MEDLIECVQIQPDCVYRFKDGIRKPKETEIGMFMITWSYNEQIRLFMEEIFK
jgi:hypothetical protein